MSFPSQSFVGATLYYGYRPKSQKRAFHYPSINHRLCTAVMGIAQNRKCAFYYPLLNHQLCTAVLGIAQNRKCAFPVEFQIYKIAFVRSCPNAIYIVVGQILILFFANDGILF